LPHSLSSFAYSPACGDSLPPLAFCLAFYVKGFSRSQI
jgi:hypothetical protein